METKYYKIKTMWDGFLQVELSTLEEAEKLAENLHMNTGRTYEIYEFKTTMVKRFTNYKAYYKVFGDEGEKQ